MKASEVFPGRFLTASDLGGTSHTVVIERALTEVIQGEPKRCLAFVGARKLLKLNRTNWQRLAEITGLDDDERWSGVRVRLVIERVPFQGKTVDAIRLEAVDAPPARQPAPPPAMPPVGEVPF